MTGAAGEHGETREAAITIREALQRANSCRGELWKDETTFSDALAALDSLLAQNEALSQGLSRVVELLTFSGRGYAPAATKSNEAREVARAALSSSAAEKAGG